MSEDTPQRLARPIRPYPEDADLVAVSASTYEELLAAECEVTELQDALANAEAECSRLDRKLAASTALAADFLLTYSADGDESNPWQAGHNYAMREAARMIRERWHELPCRIEERSEADGSWEVCVTHNSLTPCDWGEGHTPQGGAR